MINNEPKNKKTPIKESLEIGEILYKYSSLKDRKFYLSKLQIIGLKIITVVFTFLLMYFIFLYIDMKEALIVALFISAIVFGVIVKYAKENNDLFLFLGENGFEVINYDAKEEVVIKKMIVLFTEIEHIYMELIKNIDDDDSYIDNDFRYSFILKSVNNAKNKEFLISGWYDKKNRENHNSGKRNLAEKATLLWTEKNIDRAFKELENNGFYDFKILYSKKIIRITKDDFLIIDGDKSHSILKKSLIDNGALYYRIDRKWFSMKNIKISTIQDFYLMIGLLSVPESKMQEYTP